MSFVDEKHLRMRQDIEEQTRLVPFVFLDKAMIIYHRQSCCQNKMKGNPPPKKVITFRHIKCFRNNLASITAVCTWRHHRSVSWTVLLHHYSDDRCHILNPEQPPTFTAVISVITTTTRPDRQQRHSRPLFVCAVHVCVCL